MRRNPVIKSVNYIMCGAATHDAVLDTPSLKYRYSTLRNGGFIAEEYSETGFPRFSSQIRNLFITGATGYGKTYMACAFGMEACKQYYNTRYVRMPDLLMDLGIARTEGNYRKVMTKYSNPLLLILDEWMLLKPTDTEQKDIFELL